MGKVIRRYISGLKEARKVFIYIFIAVIIINSLLFFDINRILIFVFDLFLLLKIFFTINFFRKPFLREKYKKGVVYSPAEGRILSIKEVRENTYLKKKAYRIFIFMNVFNVHRNNIPVNGIIEGVEYKKGSFKAAFKEGEESNERSIIKIKAGNDKFLIKQIAGLIARRIVTNIKKGDKVKAGDEFGYITFGSAVIIYIPLNYKLLVKERERVFSGYTELAKLKK